MATALPGLDQNRSEKHLIEEDTSFIEHYDIHRIYRLTNNDWYTRNKRKRLLHGSLFPIQIQVVFIELQSYSHMLVWPLNTT